MPQNQLLPIGQWVQYNAAFDSPRSAPPSSIELTIGQIRQAFYVGGEPYYLVVWSPGDRNPKVATYHQEQLNPITQQEANQIQSQIVAGTYNPPEPTVGTSYQPPSTPAQVSPTSQTPGLYTL